MMQHVWWLLTLLVLPLAGVAADKTSAPADGRSVMAVGNADGNVPGWSILTVLPTGWTQDCCMYAKAIGVDLVMYQGEWTGKPERVMVLNVWPAKLPTLKDELRDDRKHYVQRDPVAKIAEFPLGNSSMACKAVLYSGTDKEDDVVAFCDPGKSAGVRLSWSMTVAASDPTRQDVLAQFKAVVDQSLYKKHAVAAGKPH